MRPIATLSRYGLPLLIALIVGCNSQPIDIPCGPDCIPQGFPAVVYPDSNQFSTQRWQLGKKLFFDKRLSIDGSKSCASCHLPEAFFADQRATSPGVFERAGTTNTPSLANIAYHPYFLREGGVPTLEMQILVPIQEHNEFNHNIVDIAAELATDSALQQQSIVAYGRLLDPYVITRSIATFERSLLSGNSAYDQYVFQQQKAALTDKQLAGMQLFFSEKTQCSSCHAGFNFSNYAFENNGLYLEYEHPGRMRVTNDSADLARFKVPSLRNVAQTAPYMHDGSIATLQEVIEHYNQGGLAHRNKSSLVQPLNLTPLEKEQLLHFLESLTDWEFAQNAFFQP